MTDTTFLASQVANEECQTRNQVLGLALASSHTENARQATLIQKLENDVGQIQTNGMPFAAAGGENTKLDREWSATADSQHGQCVEGPTDKAGLMLLSLRGRPHTVSTVPVETILNAVSYFCQYDPFRLRSN